MYFFQLKIFFQFPPAMESTTQNICNKCDGVEEEVKEISSKKNENELKQSKVEAQHLETETMVLENKHEKL